VINVIIADHEPIFRAGVAKLLAAEDDIRIIAQPQSMDRLITVVNALRPNVLMVSPDFLSLLTDIHQVTMAAVNRQVAVMLLAATTKDMWGLVPFGVNSVIPRSASGDLLLKGVRELARGGFYFPTNACGKSRTEIRQRVISRLSRRELKIIANVVQGYKNREIAARLGTSEQMIKNAMTVIYDKTGVSDRLELVLFVIHHHVLAQSPNGPLWLTASVPRLIRA
jgi:DNA-binding NarL/FixJ family response regulator